MVTTRSSIGQEWIDASSPTKEEVDSLILIHKIDLEIANDLLTPTPKQYAKKFNDYLYTVLHIPHFIHSSWETIEQEIDFVISPKTIITTRYDSIEAMHTFAKKIEVNQILNRDEESHLFLALMKEIYNYVYDETDFMRDWVKEIEKRIFEGKQKEMVYGISRAGRNVLSFKRILLPHGQVWESILELGEGEFGKKFEKELRTLYLEWQRLMVEIKNIGEMLDELRDTNNSILTSTQNEIMKTFTVLAFIAFPLSLTASIFGMNSVYNPIVGGPYDFWIILGIMSILSLAMYLCFKYKKWI